MNKVIQFFPARQIRSQPFLLEQLQSQAQLFNQARGEEITVDDHPRFLKTDPTLIDDIRLHTTHHKVDTRAADDLCGIARFPRQFHEDP